MAKIDRTMQVAISAPKVKSWDTGAVGRACKSFFKITGIVTLRTAQKSAQKREARNFAL